ncbi:MAG: hypothetical protein IPK83_23880 [Planctomycetes bacterium]|nr:hypothetical protein [Planctomycetota bacterium]
MFAAISRADDFLHARGDFLPAFGTKRPAWWMPAIIVGFAPLYGALMGSFQFDSAERLLQIAYSAIKAPLLLGATTILCLPVFFVINTILGLRDDFRDAIQSILAGQAGLSVTLASLGPFTRFWYFSTEDYRAALLFNAAMFTIATAAGQLVMWRYYRILVRRNLRHVVALALWLVLYAFVGIQMGWILRPFIGSPGMDVTFFREGAFTNAYVVVAELIVGR